VKRSDLLIFLFVCTFLTGADIVIINGDAAGVGLNDPEPRAPIAGNNGTTLGEQRLNVISRAVEIWAASLDSDVPIRILARSITLPCTTNQGTLARASANVVNANFPNAPIADIWYHGALANALAGFDLLPDDHDITVEYNLALDDDPGCLGGDGWYYGFDHDEGFQSDLLAVLLHEFAHGLGFANFLDESTGEFLIGRTDIYTFFTYDTETDLAWDDMTQSQLLDSVGNDPNVVWVGDNVTDAFPDYVAGLPDVSVTTPNDIAGTERGQPAQFGPRFPVEGMSSEVVLAVDGTDPVNNGCEPLTNGADLLGKIVLIDRGECDFTVKVANAQAQGALAVMIANNVADGLPPMGGSDPSITIPSVGITQALGNQMKTWLPGVQVSIDPSTVDFEGSNEGFLRLHAPNPVALGSSISHWTIDATPSLLMEPNITPDLTDDVDLTLFQFMDLGWPLLLCSPIINDGQTVVADACVGDTVTFSINGEGDDVTYQWRKNGAELMGETDPSLELTGLDQADAGDYDCVLTNGCDESQMSGTFALSVDDVVFETVLAALWNTSSDNPCRDLDDNAIVDILDLVGLVSNTGP